GMAVTLLANGALYMALLFGWFYLWTVAPQWQLPADSRVAWPMWLLACVLMVLGWWCFRRRVLRLRDGEDQGLARALWAIAALGLVQCLTLAAAWHGSVLAPRATAHDAVITVFLLYLLLHCALATLMTALQALRVRYGYVGRL